MNQPQKRILIVEDNDSSMELLRFILAASGYTVFGAADGLAGVEQARKLKPDLILMDIQLPEIDGLEATRRIRKLPGFQDTQIVAITSYAMLGDRDRALQAGCSGYIEKPINTDTIVAELEAYLK